MRSRLEWYERRAGELDEEQRIKGGIVRHDLWRRQYCAHPYMLGSPDEAVKRRFHDTFLNAMDPNDIGQLAARHAGEIDKKIWKKLTHSLEESGARGCVTTADMGLLQEHIRSYWKNGDPQA